MSDIDLSTFPSNRIEALTILHLNNQNLSTYSPEEVAQLYLQTYKEIQIAFHKKSSREKDGFPQTTL